MADGDKKNSDTVVNIFAATTLFVAPIFRAVELKFKGTKFLAGLKASVTTLEAWASNIMFGVTVSCLHFIWKKIYPSRNQKGGELPPLPSSETLASEVPQTAFAEREMDRRMSKPQGIVIN